MIPTQSEMRIDDLMKFMKEQYDDFLKQWLERNSFIQKFVSGELAKAYDEINKRLVESFNRFAPMFRNISNRIALMNMKLVTLGKVVKEEGKTTRQQLLDDANALGKQLESGQTQTTKLITDSTGAIVNQLENGQTQTANLLTNGFTSMGNQLTDNQTHTTNLLTNGINAVGDKLVENQTQTANLLTNGFTSMGTQLADNQTHTTNLLTNGFTSMGNQLANTHSQTANLLTDGINAVGNQLANTQLTRDQLYQDLYQQNMRGIIQNFMDAIYQGYANLMNQPLRGCKYSKIHTSSNRSSESSCSID